LEAIVGRTVAVSAPVGLAPSPERGSEIAQGEEAGDGDRIRPHQILDENEATLAFVGILVSPRQADDVAASRNHPADSCDRYRAPNLCFVIERTLDGHLGPSEQWYIRPQ
jgi:hypothetical protein